MSQAEMLLNSLYVETASDMDDGILVIDNYTRSIRIPESVTNLGVESDDEVLRLQFKMPRFYYGIDLSTFNIRINYENANQEGDVYEVSDAEARSDEIITFSWLVGRHAALYRGIVTFSVCLRDVDPEGNILREFNTTVARLPILEGLETGEQAVAPYNDLLEQWHSMLFGAGNSSGGALVDEATGDIYTLKVRNGKLMMEVV